MNISPGPRNPKDASEEPCKKDPRLLYLGFRGLGFRV